VEAFQFLLFAEADAVLAELAAAIAVHARSGVASLDGALGAFAATALEVQLDALAPAEFTDRVDGSCHKIGCRMSGNVGQAFQPDVRLESLTYITHVVSSADGSRCAAAG